MVSFLSRVRAFDSFGQSVSINYNGDSFYKTLPGALLTFVLSVLIFGFTILSFVELIEYRNPNVSQVSVSQIRSRQATDKIIYSL